MFEEFFSVEKLAFLKLKGVDIEEIHVYAKQAFARRVSQKDFKCRHCEGKPTNTLMKYVNHIMSENHMKSVIF